MRCPESSPGFGLLELPGMLTKTEDTLKWILWIRSAVVKDIISHLFRDAPLWTPHLAGEGQKKEPKVGRLEWPRL